MPIALLHQGLAVEIKALLWEGNLRQNEIAAKFAISQSTVSKIKKGQSWFYAPWPDGRIGPFPVDREKSLRIQKNPLLYPTDLPDLSPQANIIDGMTYEERMQKYLEIDDEIKRKEDEELRQIVADYRGDDDPPSRDEEEAPPPPIPFEPERWESCLKLAPENPLVKEAKEGDECQKIAVYLALAELDEDKWTGPLARQHYDAFLPTIRQLKKGSP